MNEEHKQYLADTYDKLFGRDDFVVVMYRNTEPHVYVARVLSLGLSAYGDTAEEAKEKLVRMFSSLVHAYCSLPYKEKDQ